MGYFGWDNNCRNLFYHFSQAFKYNTKSKNWKW